MTASAHAHAEPGIAATTLRFFATVGVSGWLMILLIYLPSVYDLHQSGYHSAWLVAMFAVFPLGMLLVALGGIRYARRNRLLPALACAGLSLLGLLLALFVTVAFTVT